MDLAKHRPPTPPCRSRAHAGAREHHVSPRPPTVTRVTHIVTRPLGTRQPTLRERRWRATLPLLLLVIAGVLVALALIRYGLTPATGSLALLVVAAAALTGFLRPRQPGELAGSVNADVARRAMLTGAALTAAAAVGETRQIRVRAEASDPGQIVLTEYSRLATDRRDESDPATWDWTPSLRAAVDTAAQRAQRSAPIDGTDASRRTGLPTVHIPRGTYRLTGRVDLHYLHGLTVTGEGRQVSVLEFEGDDVLFDVHRSSALTFSGLTIAGQDPAVDEDDDIRGLREGSCAFRFVERTDDVAAGGGNTYMVTFNNLEVNEMHYAFAFVGDQMTDGMVWNDLHLRDNFFDFDYANGNTVNHQVFGGEVLYGVSFPEPSYARRLGTWTDPPDLRDGATVNVSTGGDLSFFGVSIIVRKPTLAFASPPQDASQGAVSNIAGYNFFATRWEFRDRDPAGDEAGLQRSTLVRWHVPAPTNRLVQPTLRFDACRFVVLVDDLDLLYLTNAVAISWDGCRIFPPTRGRVVSLVSPATATLPGAFLAEGSSVVPVIRRLVGAADASVDHVIEVSPRAAPDVGQGGSPAGYSTVLAGHPSTARRVLHRSLSGNLLEPAQPMLQVELRVPPGALLRQVGAVFLGPDLPQDVSVAFSADGQSIGNLVLREGDTKPSLLVESFTPSGFLQVVMSRDGAEPVPGYVYVEYF